MTVSIAPQDPNEYLIKYAYVPIIRAITQPRLRGHDAVTLVRLGTFFGFQALTFLRSFAAARSRVLCSLAAFISLGAVVRSCLICVGMSVRPCS